MKIRIKTPISIPEIPTEMQMESGKLRDVLNTLLGKSYFAKEVVDPRTGEFTLDGLFQVLLNDVSYDSLPGGIETELHDGDTVTLTLILLGGG
jgi:hypothetical protein